MSKKPRHIVEDGTVINTKTGKRTDVNSNRQAKLIAAKRNRADALVKKLGVAAVVSAIIGWAVLFGGVLS